MMRAMCGHTSPTNPIRPVKLTIPAVSMETMNRDASLRRLALIPMERADSSPVERTLRRRDMTISSTPAMKVNANMVAMWSHPFTSRVPTLQAKMLARVSASTQSLIMVVMALKMYITAIPAIIMVAGEAPRIFDTKTMTAMGTREKTNALATIPTPPAPTTVSPNPMARDAPKEAPEETPVV